MQSGFCVNHLWKRTAASGIDTHPRSAATRGLHPRSREGIEGSPCGLLLQAHGVVRLRIKARIAAESWTKLARRPTLIVMNRARRHCVRLKSTPLARGPFFRQPLARYPHSETPKIALADLSTPTCNFLYKKGNSTGKRTNSCITCYFSLKQVTGTIEVSD